MRVAVTGAHGFTGRYVTAELERRGHEAVPLDADITDVDALDRAVAAAQPDAAVHLAAIAFVATQDSGAIYRVNQLGSFHLLDALTTHAPGAPVLIASSAQVYGGRGAGLLDEDTPFAPANPYALSKAAMELGATWWRDRLRLIVVRPFNYTGVGQENRYVVPKIIDCFARRSKMIRLGNLSVRRDFGDVRAVARVYCDLLERGEPITLNVATGRLRSIDDVLDQLTAATGHRPRIEVDPTFVRPDDVASLGGDITRLCALLPEWRRESFDDTLSWMLAAAQG